MEGTWGIEKIIWAPDSFLLPKYWSILKNRALQIFDHKKLFNTNRLNPIWQSRPSALTKLPPQSSVVWAAKSYFTATWRQQ